MAKIKNMGTATMRFGEGVIVTGNASNPDGSDSGFNLVVSGNVKIAEGADLIFQKGESETSFIQFKNADDGTSYNAYFAYQAAEHIYISPGRGADFYLQQRTNVGGDPYTYPFRVFDDGKVKFEVGQSDANDSATDLPSDVVFYVSGSNDSSNNAVFGGNIVVSGSSNLLGDLSVQDTATYNTVEYFNSNTMKFNQYYLGNANGSYFSANEYQKVVTIIPSANSQNYQVIGRITAQNAGSTHTVYFNSALRSNTLPDLSWSATYSEEHTGTRYIDPQLWVKETTTAGFIFAFKTLQTIYGNITVDIDVVPRSSDQKSNVTINNSVSSEQTSVDAGYTANDMTLVISKNSQTISFANAYAFPTADGNANQVLTTDGVGNLSFQAAQTGSGANPPGGSDRHVQFNDNGSFAGNYGILVDSNFNLKVSGSLISKEAIGLGTDLGGGRNGSDEWVAITEPQHKFHVIGNATENADFSIDSASDTVGGAYWTFTKARGTPASPTGINTNDEIARIQFFAHTGSSTLKRSAMIYTTADSDGDGKMAFYVTRNGDQDNKALEFYDNQVKAHDQVVLISGMIPETAGGTSIGATSLPFDYIRGNNIVAFDSFLLGATHPLYDRGGHGITINKDNPILGNYTSGEGLAYISNNSGVENVVFALHKTGSHFAGMSLNGNVTDSDQKLVFFSQYNTAGFEWKNNIPYYNANGMGNLNTTGTSLMSLDSSGNLELPTGGLSASGNVTISGEERINDPGYATGYQADRSFTFKRHYNFSGVAANTWHDIITWRPYLEGTTTDPGASTFYGAVSFKLEISGHTNGVGNGYKSRIGYVSYEGSSAASANASDTDLGSPVSTDVNRSGWVTKLRFNPNQVGATGFSGTVYVEIHFARGAGSNGEAIEWNIT